MNVPVTNTTVCSVEADPTALTDYIICLLETDKPEEQLHQNLEVFFGEGVFAFVC